MKKILILLAFILPSIVIAQGDNTAINIGQSNVFSNGIFIDNGITDISLTGSTNRGLFVDSNGVYQSIPTEVVVNVASDFGKVVDGKYFLKNNHHYSIKQTVFIADSIVLPKRCGFSTIDGAIANLIYTGSGTLFTGDSVESLFITDFLGVSTSGNARLFNLTGFVDQLPAFVILKNQSWIGFNDVGIIRKSSMNMSSTGFINFDKGIKIDSMLITQMIGNLYQNAVTSNDTFITITGNNPLLEIKDCIFNTSPGEFVLGISPDVEVGVAVITGNVFQNGTAQFLSSTSPSVDDIRFTYKENGESDETDEEVSLTITSTSATSVTSGTPTKVLGTYSTVILKRFTHSEGIVTYIGKKTRTFEIVVASSVTSASNNHIIDLYVAKDIAP